MTLEEEQQQEELFTFRCMEVIFSSPFVCLFVSRVTQKLLDRFSQNLVERRWTVTEETIRFGCNLDHVVRVRVRLGL